MRINFTGDLRGKNFSAPKLITAFIRFGEYYFREKYLGDIGIIPKDTESLYWFGLESYNYICYNFQLINKHVWICNNNVAIAFQIRIQCMCLSSFRINSQGFIAFLCK